MLGRAKFFFLARMPPDRRRIKNNFRAAQRCQSCRLRIPLVPANADADLAGLCFPRLKTKIARRGIKLLVMERIVRNVHLAIFSEELPVAIDEDRKSTRLNSSHRCML